MLPCMPSLSVPGRLDEVRSDLEDADEVAGVNPDDLAVGDLNIGPRDRPFTGGCWY